MDSGTIGGVAGLAFYQIVAREEGVFEPTAGLREAECAAQRGAWAAEIP